MKFPKGQSSYIKTESGPDVTPDQTVRGRSMAFDP